MSYKLIKIENNFYVISSEKAIQHCNKSYIKPNFPCDTVREYFDSLIIKQGINSIDEFVITDYLLLGSTNEQLKNSAQINTMCYELEAHVGENVVIERCLGNSINVLFYNKE